MSMQCQATVAGGADYSPSVIEGSISHVGDFGGIQVKNLGYVMCHVSNCTLLLGANIVRLPYTAFVQDDVKCLCHIFYVQIAARGCACTTQCFNLALGISRELSINRSCQSQRMLYDDWLAPGPKSLVPKSPD